MTPPRSTVRGFTLVELLVVIGIIALLISILLPSLQSARKAANAVKCMTQQREIGNAFRYYSNDFDGYYPPGLLTPASGQTYNLNGNDFPVLGLGAYWFNFIEDYVTSGGAGVTNTDDAEAAGIKNRSVLWGCSEWQGYYRNSSSDSIDFNRVQPGYGMNAYAGFTKRKSTSDPDETAYNFSWAPGQTNGFVKQTLWDRNSSERMLIADSRLWLAESSVPPADGSVAPQMGEYNAANQLPGQTYISVFRHGNLPAAPVPNANRSFDTKQGKVNFNILYSDGHVAGNTDPKEAFRSIRMTYPDSN